jgi:hypothetical protein
MNMQASSGGHPTSEELENALRRSLYRFDCPDAHTLGEYQLDLLAPEQRTSVAAHAVECEACTAELQTLRAFLAIPTTVPDSIVERARRVVAALLNPAPGLAFGGLRGAADPDTRVYVADDVTVSLASTDEPHTLLGLVVDLSVAEGMLAGRPVQLIASDGAALATTLDHLGNFEFDGVPAGTYVLELDLTGRLVAVEALRVD